MANYVTYLRVSTKMQGKSGLGLDAQRKMCADFVRARDGVIVQEFVDVESGTHRDRKGLQDAMAYCKANGCPLVIAKLDRLARDVEFCFKVVNTGIEIHFTDMPMLNTLLLGVFASVAQYERELTSERTKKALEVKKAQGALLGGANENYKASRARKTQGELDMENARMGATRTKRYQDSRDVAVFIRVMRNVFPNATKNEDPAYWRWGTISMKACNCERVLAMMRDYKEVDTSGELFARWDFTDIDNDKQRQKVRSYLQAFKKSMQRKGYDVLP